MPFPANRRYFPALTDIGYDIIAVLENVRVFLTFPLTEVDNAVRGIFLCMCASYVLIIAFCRIQLVKEWMKAYSLPCGEIFIEIGSVTRDIRRIKMEYTIRVANTSDAQAVHDIYGAYVDSEHVTFTIDNPSVEEYREKIEKTLKKYPFYVAEDTEGKVLGYVYGSPLRPHDAYQWNVESTIVLAPDTPRRCGIATALYRKFMETLKKQGYRYVYGVIVDTNEASIALHQALGFTQVGHFKKAGFKNGKWKGIVWMQIALTEDEQAPQTPLPFDGE